MHLAQFFVLNLFFLFWIFINVHASLNNNLYQINWPGSTSVNLNNLAPPGVEYNSDNGFIVTSSNKESYQCTIPSQSLEQVSFNQKALTKCASDLLAPVLKSEICSYIVESYWSYELCPGKHIKQYHEERTRQSSGSSTTYYLKNENGKIVLQQDGKSDLIKTTEFFLGYYKEDITKTNCLLEEDKSNSFQVPTKIINGVKTPYFVINMTDGTPCDLKSGVGRRSRILYICGQVSRTTLLSVSETSSCEYELVVLTSELCKHPHYKVEGQEVNQIQCVPLGDSPVKPAALTKFMQDQSKDSSRGHYRGYHHYNAELSKSPGIDSTSISSIVDQTLLRDFLSGSHCLHGGSGWWRFEYCYGRHVQQYHDDRNAGRTTIIVGKWDKEKHIAWVEKKSSSPVIYKQDNQGIKTITQVAHFYGDGDVCEETGKLREVVVRMKCKKDGASPHSVAIYLLEPNKCSYVLGVESPIFCDLLHTADDQGLLSLN